MDTKQYGTVRQSDTVNERYLSDGFHRVLAKVYIEIDNIIIFKLILATVWEFKTIDRKTH